MLGLASIEYWSNNTTASNIEETRLSTDHQANEEHMQSHARLTWRLSNRLDGPQWPLALMKMSPTALATALMAVCHGMFRLEDETVHVNSSLRDQRRSAFPHVHRGTLAAILKILTSRIDTDWSDVSKILVDKITADKHVASGTKHSQEFITHLSTHSLCHHPLLRGTVADEHYSDHRAWKFASATDRSDLDHPAKGNGAAFRIACL
jgi:hypothetical protein